MRTTELAGHLALITGAAGFVGSRIAKRLLEDGLGVRGLDRRPDTPAGVELVRGEVTDPAAVKSAIAGVTLIVHCAAVIVGSREEMARVNVEGTRLLLEAAARGDCRRFLYMSTAAVYAFNDRAEVDESTPFRQEGPDFYLSRVAAERVVWVASAQGLAVTVFRPYYILGAHPTATWSALFAARIARGEYALPGDGSGSWPYVHVDNLAEAVVTAARSGPAVGQAYNLVDGQTTAREYAERFQRWLGAGPLPTRPEAALWRGRLVGDKAVRELGYAPRVTYEQAMAETEQYLRERGMVAR